MTGNGCKDSCGNVYAHVCNAAKNGKGCGSEEHGRNEHV